MDHEVVSPLIDVSATNVVGMGATRLVQSLLPALEQRLNVRHILVPQSGELTNYQRTTSGPAPKAYRRILPNGLSRILECTFYSGRVAGGIPLLVLGDLPVRTPGKQILLIHQSHLAGGRWTGPSSLKFRLMRLIFRINISFITTAIVQSEVMKAMLEANYPQIAGKVVVIPQPAPAWLMAAERRTGSAPVTNKLRLFYPAAAYPHKNHRLLEEWAATEAATTIVDSLRLTVSPKPKAAAGMVLYLGQLSPQQIVEAYSSSDALIFPSLEESYGLPLVEAMFLGLPILCSDRPYARSLCGDQAIYFDPKSVQSLQRAVNELSDRLKAGWRPDWRNALMAIPRTWDEVAVRFAELF
jgi:Glycosyl transferases group 1